MRTATKVFMGSLLLFALSGCGAFVSGNDVLRAVEKQGYGDPKIVSQDILFVNWRGCGREDQAVFKIEATNALGKRVELTACVGWPFKGVTIRT